MISTIVVPLDGTARAERALIPAHLLAQCFGASVLLFRAAGDDSHEVAAYLDARAGPFGDRTVITVVHQGFESCGLADTVRRIPNAAVCMASDLAADGGAAVGPVAEDMIDAGTTPVLLVGPACRSGSPEDERPRAVLCTDGSAAASSIEPVVVEWATALGLDVHLLTVLHPAHTHLAEIPVDRVLREIHSLAFRLERQGLAVSTEILDDGIDPAYAINRYIENHPTALIATSARGNRHNVHPVLGDTVHRLIRLAAAPVLVARPVPGAYHS